MNSFIHWIGGKSQLRETIIAAFPKESPDKYIEVFGGAGWVLFARDKHAPAEVFNDIDGQLINLYRCVQHHCGELQRELRMNQHLLPIQSRELFAEYRTQLNASGLTDIQRAARYYYIIRLSFGANRSSFNTKNAPYGSTIDRLPEIAQRLEKVVIENRDFEALLKSHDKPGSLFYLDPPYYNAENCYQGFAPADHERLAAALARVKGMWVLSYNDTPEIRQLYNTYNIKAVCRANNLSTGPRAGAYKELLITNY